MLHALRYAGAFERNYASLASGATRYVTTAGDTIELQVGQTDSPTFRPDNLPSSLTLSSLSLTLPTREQGTVALTPSA